MIGALWKLITSNDRVHVTFCVTGASTAVAATRTQKHLPFFSGIVGCLMLYGVLQERIMAEPFAPDGALFKDSLFLVNFPDMVL